MGVRVIISHGGTAHAIRQAVEIPFVSCEATSLDLINTLLEKMLARSSNEWISKFRNVGLSCGRVNTMDRIFNHPQIKPRNMVAEVKHPNAKKVKLVGIPVKYSETPGSVRLPPLLLDQHHQEILQDLLCYSKEETEIFSHEDVIWSPFSISHTFI